MKSIDNGQTVQFRVIKAEFTDDELGIDMNDVRIEYVQLF